MKATMEEIKNRAQHVAKENQRLNAERDAARAALLSWWEQQPH